LERKRRAAEATWKEETEKWKVSGKQDMFKYFGPLPPPIPKRIPVNRPIRDNHFKPVQCDPLKFVYFYLQDVLNNPKSFGSKPAKRFLSKFYDKDTPIKEIIESATVKVQAELGTPQSMGS